MIVMHQPHLIVPRSQFLVEISRRKNQFAFVFGPV